LIKEQLCFLYNTKRAFKALPVFRLLRKKILIRVLTDEQQRKEIQYIKEYLKAQGTSDVDQKVILT
jgi:hypothetical protein